jgi:hypothetical protein
LTDPAPFVAADMKNAPGAHFNLIACDTVFQRELKKIE